jgi:hypothetical protein
MPTFGRHGSEAFSSGHRRSRPARPSLPRLVNGNASGGRWSSRATVESPTGPAEPTTSSRTGQARAAASDQRATRAIATSAQARHRRSAVERFEAMRIRAPDSTNLSGPTRTTALGRIRKRGRATGLGRRRLLNGRRAASGGLSAPSCRIEAVPSYAVVSSRCTGLLPSRESDTLRDARRHPWPGRSDRGIGRETLAIDAMTPAP